jgi:hypothetical protein
MSDTGTNSRGSRRVWIIAGSAVAGLTALVLVLVFALFIPQGVTSDGNKKEASLSGWYSNAVTALHNCTAKTARAAQVTKGQTDAVDKVLKGAVAGRYGTGNNIDQAKMFSAMVEAYPDGSVEGLNKTFQDTLTVMTGCQDDFTAAQGVVQAQVATFKSWRTGSWKVRTFGGDDFPNENLEINIAGMPHLTGREALALISRPILDTDTVNAIKSGEDNSFSDDPFATPTPSR